MEIKNEILYKAMRDYVSAAIDFVAKRAKEEAPSSDPDSDLDFYWIHARYTSDLSEIPEYRSCLKELTTDEKISRHLDANVGSYSRGTHAPTAENMMRHVLDLGRRDGQYTFNSERFDREYSFFEETFYSDGLLCEAIAPMQGLLLLTQVVTLSDGLEIRRLDEDEMKPYRAPGSRWDERWCAVRAKYEVPKIIGSKSGDRFDAMLPGERYAEMEKERALEERANERIEDVINALRLFGKCDVYHSGIIHESSKWLFIHSYSVANRMLGSGLCNYEFGGDYEINSFTLLWSKLENSKVKRNLNTTLRRFSYSCVRHQNEDKIIDLMIAAEALFLRGKRMSEKSSSLALRAGHFLGTDTASRAEISDHMRKAYKLRNSVVHEGHFASVLNPEDGNIEEFIGKIGDYIQKAIFKAINLLSNSETIDDLDDKYWAGLIPK